MISKNPKVRVRMYRQGLGDCFLLTFFIIDENKKEKQVHMLIDCGTLGKGIAGNEMADVIEDIHQTTKGQLDLLVITHEHKDHVSGFNKTGQKVFGEFQVDNVWLPWTEDPEDDLAKSIKKYEHDLLSSLLLTVQTLSKNEAPYQEEKKALLGIASSTWELLNFSGGSFEDGNMLAADDDFAETVHAAMSYASLLAKKVIVIRKDDGTEERTEAKIPPTFLWPRKKETGKPEQGPVLEPEFLPGWRFYVLGPPYDPEKINRLDTDQDGVLYHLSKGLAVDLAANTPFFESSLPAASYRDCSPLAEDLVARQRFDAGFPFDACFRIEKDNHETSNLEAYTRLAESYKSEDWRCIDYDWLASVGDFALQLDNSTNNSSLVLAIEYIDDGRVLLFPGDAQLGNWESWDGSMEETGKLRLKDKNEKEYEVEYQYPIEFTRDDKTKVTPIDLLRRTVFYKVGHHASHNATTVAGLEAMQATASKDLVAMIPLDSDTAAKKGKEGWNMPEPKLYQALLEMTNGLVLRSDIGWPSAEEEQEKTLWYEKNKNDWPKVKKTIEEKTIGIREHTTIEKIDNVTVFVYTDPTGKFRIEYPIHPPDTKQIPKPHGKYIDYYLY
jgi:hypothetical protein